MQGWEENREEREQRLAWEEKGGHQGKEGKVGKEMLVEYRRERRAETGKERGGE